MPEREKEACTAKIRPAITGRNICKTYNENRVVWEALQGESRGECKEHCSAVEEQRYLVTQLTDERARLTKRGPINFIVHWGRETCSEE